MDALESYAPRVIGNLSLTPHKSKGKIPASQRVILFRPNTVLTSQALASIGTRLLDLRPQSVFSTVQTLDGAHLSVIVYIVEDIAHLDMTYFSFDSSNPHKAQQLYHMRTSNYLDVIPNLDGCMAAVINSH